MTLHLSGPTGETDVLVDGERRYWEIGKEFSTMLAHPSIQNLTLSCADIHGSLIRQIKNLPLTPLKRLTLIECNIDLAALDAILSRPRALEHLYLGNECPSLY